MRVWSEWSYARKVSTYMRLDWPVTAYLNGAGSRDLVGEVTGVEVALEAADRKKKLCTLNLFFDLRMTNRSDVDLCGCQKRRN